MKDLLRTLSDVSRRDFVVRAARKFLGVSIAASAVQQGASQRVIAAPAPRASGGGKAKYCIYLYMDGGMSHLDTFDPGKKAEVAGSTKPINTNADGVQIAEFLPQMAKHMDKCAVIRSMTSTNGAHERGKYVTRTSYAPLATIVHPSMGAWVSKFATSRGTLPSAIVIGGGADHPSNGYLEATHAPIRLGNPFAGLQDSKLPEGIPPEQFVHRLNLTEKLDKAFTARYQYDSVKSYTDFYDDAVKLMKSQDLKAFELAQEPKELRDAYGNNYFGQGCLLARRLIQHDVRYVEVNFGGWDHHEDIFSAMGRTGGTLDQAMATLLSDLQAKGLLKDTLVVLSTEFGRTPKINTGGGRDHHPRVYSCVLAGGPVRGGQVYGKSDDMGHAPDVDPVQVEDFNATIASAIGLPIDKTVYSPSGRPFKIAHKGKVIPGIV
jgi:hypothetical protein